MNLDQTQLERGFAAYYDQDAAQRARRDLDPERVVQRAEFAEALRRDGLSRVLEIGAGPGKDAAALRDEGLRVVGLDLAHEHARLTRSQGVACVRASAVALPFQPSSFDAVWSMSTFMHLPDAAFRAAMKELRRVIVPGGLAALGMWAGADEESISDHDVLEPARYFNRRSDDSLVALVSEAAQIQQLLTWRARDERYQWLLLRMPAGTQT